jgi:predicted hotdog family 3-hydroxylacyl-ACP dehydratase
VKRESPPHGDASLLRGGTRLPLRVPPSGPLFEGHFPGRLILPGVGLLDLALRALAAAGASPALREIVTLRLRRPVAPGDILELDVQTLAPDGRARLEVRRAAEVVANAVVLLGDPSSGTGAVAPAPEPPSTAGPPRLAPGARRASGVPDLDNLLPHRPPMRFVTGIETETDDGVVCAVRVPGGSAFTVEGSAPALVALEMAAQSAAVYEALRRFRETGAGGARVGYLVGARDVRFARARVPAGETLYAVVRLSGIALPLCTYVFEVALGSEVVASGTVSTWLTATGA